LKVNFLEQLLSVSFLQ